MTRHKFVNGGLVAFLAVASWMTTAAAQSQEADSSLTIQIVNSSGDSVSDAAVYWVRNGKSRRLKPEDGRITGIAPTGFLVAQKNGYRYSGIALKDTPTFLVLKSPAEPGGSYQTLPCPFDSDTEKKLKAELAKLLIDSLNQAADSSPALLSSGLKSLAMVAPSAALKFLDSNDLNEMQSMAGRNEIIKAFAKTDVATAAEVADSVKQPEVRSVAFFSLLSALPSDSPHRQSVEQQFFDANQSITNPGFRLAAIADYADDLRIAGKIEQSESLISQHIEEVTKLPSGGWSAYPRSLFAAQIVNKQPELAQQLLEGIDRENEANRAAGRLAFHCCQSNPELAIELLKKIKTPPNSLVTHTRHVRVADQMAILHPAKAKELAKSIPEPNQRAWAFGLIAMRISKNSPDEAKRLLQLAMETLERISAANDASGFLKKSQTMAVMLRIAEQVAPEELESMIWQSAWHAIPKSRWSQQPGGLTKLRQQTATCIARFDHQIGKSLAGNPLKFADAKSSIVSSMIFAPEQLFSSLAKASETNPRLTNSRTLEIPAQCLQGGRSSFWNRASTSNFLPWPSRKYESR